MEQLKSIAKSTCAQSSNMLSRVGYEKHNNSYLHIVAIVIDDWAF